MKRFLSHILLIFLVLNVNSCQETDNSKDPTILLKALKFFKSRKVDEGFDLLKNGFPKDNQWKCMKVAKFVDLKLRLSSKSIPFYMCAAKHGNRRALLSLRWIFTDPIRANPLHPVFNKLIQKYALESMDAELLYAAGDAMFRSKGYEKMGPEILKFWKLSAKGKWPEAVFRIGLEYMTGRLVAQDLNKAAIHFEKCIDLKYYWCAHQYGEKLITGKFFKPNVEKAKEIFEKTLKAGSGDGLSIYARYLLKGTKELKKNKKEAYQIYQEVDNQGYSLTGDGYRRLANCYNRGKVCPKDKEKYLTLLRKAAIKFDGKSCHKLGKMYMKGKRVPKDLIEAYLLNLMGLYKGFQPSIGAGNKIVDIWKKSVNNVEKNVLRFKMFCIKMRGKLKLSKVYDPNLNHGIALFYGLRGTHDPKKAITVVAKSVEGGNEEAKLVLKMLKQEYFNLSK